MPTSKKSKVISHKFTITISKRVQEQEFEPYEIQVSEEYITEKEMSLEEKRERFYDLDDFVYQRMEDHING
jgi:hypothetical protein